jgi:hypothetical protein
VDVMSENARAVVAATIAGVGASAALFATFAPTFYEMRAEDHADIVAHRTSIRHGYTAAAALTLASGWASAALLGNGLPFVAAVAVAGVQIAGYEYWIAHPAREETGPVPSWQRALSWGAAGASGGA